MKNVARFDSQQARAILARHFPDSTASDLHAISTALEHLALALELLDRFLQQQAAGAFASPGPLLAALSATPEHSVFAGSEYRDCVFRLHNLARLFQDYGELDKAREILLLALQLDRKQYGDEHFKTATSLNRLGVVFHEQGRLESAFEAFSAALGIDESALGASHLNVARDLNNLAILARDSGDLSAAYSHLSRACAICEDKLGAAHSYTQIVNSHLSQVEKQMI